MYCAACKSSFCWLCNATTNGHTHRKGEIACIVKPMSYVIVYPLLLYVILSKLGSSNIFYQIILQVIFSVLSLLYSVQLVYLGLIFSKNYCNFVTFCIFEVPVLIWITYKGWWMSILINLGYIVLMALAGGILGCF